MKYVRTGDDGSIHIQPYLDYLDAEGAHLGELVDGESLLMHGRNGLIGRDTFHDGRVRKVTLETVPGASPTFRATILLLGPYFDRWFELVYEGVVRWSGDVPGRDTDLIVHELRREGDTVIHPFDFDRGITIEVVASRVRFREWMAEGNVS